MISKNYSPTKRRAISSIIGSFFFIVIMVAAFGAILTAMSLQAQLVEQQTDLSKQYVKQFQENYEIEAFCGATNLGIFLKNIGANEVQVATIWYYEQAGPTFDAVPVDISFAKSFVPPGGKVDVLDDLSTTIPLAGLSGMYTIKVVSTLGNILETEFNAACPQGPDDPLQDQLVAKPAIYAAFPNPWNSDAEYGYFAIILVNPTANDMTVYRIALSVISNSNPDSFSSGTVGEPLGMPAGGTWDQDDDSVYWQSLTGSVVVKKYSVQEFIAKAQPHNSIKQSTINTINTNTLTSFGQFGGIKIDTIGTDIKDFGVPNIFLADDTSDTTPTYIISPVTSPQTMIIAFHNSADSEIIKQDSKLVLNIPAAFTIINPDTLNAGFDDSPVEITFDDGSTQLTWNLTADLPAGGLVPADGTVYVGVTVEPPILSIDSIYIFHSYAYGITTNPGIPDPKDRLIGPVAEFAVKVCQSGGCLP